MQGYLNITSSQQALALLTAQYDTPEYIHGHPCVRTRISRNQDRHGPIHRAEPDSHTVQCRDRLAEHCRMPHSGVRSMEYTIYVPSGAVFHVLAHVTPDPCIGTPYSVLRIDLGSTTLQTSTGKPCTGVPPEARSEIDFH